MIYSFNELFIDDTKNVERVSSNQYLKEGKIVIIDQGKTDIVGYTNNENYKICNEERIIFGDHTRIFKYVNRPFVTGADGTKVLKLIDNSKNNYKYFYYYLKHSYIPDTGYNRHFKWVKELQFNVAEIKKQLEIVNVLDKIQQIIDIRKKQIEELDVLIKARFVELFVDKNFPEITIGELVASKVSFVKKVFLPTDTIKYIDISSIDNIRNIMTGFTEYVLEDAPSRAQQHIRKGDIVVSTVRPNLKNVAITGYDYDNLVASSGFCVLRAEKCLSSYLMAVVCSDDFTDAMTKVVTGANYPAIKDSDVKNYVVPNPPMELQEQFANFVEQTDKSKLELQKSLEEMQNLFDSLMAEYFG